MAISQIDRNTEVNALRRKIANDFAGKVFSDLVQIEGTRELQYVDLVMEGGGVLGIALVGYVHALECAGIRFLSTGGTSAGSILALLLMACKERNEAKSDTILDIVFSMDMKKFVDGDDDAKDFSLLLAEGDLAKKPSRLAWYGLQVIDNISNDIGLNPGTVFQRWLEGHLAAFRTPTLADLNRRIAFNPGNVFKRGRNEPEADLECRLGIVAADVTTETKVVFPEMAGMYWGNVERVSPAQFVRASMSIPLFFHPYRVQGIHSIPDRKELWETLAGYTGDIPDEVLFLDGGTMSNFPIALFHVGGVPVAPTFGVKLGSKRRRYHRTTDVFSYGMNLFNAIRHYADFDFIARNQDYNQLIGYIDTDAYNWLDFFMTDDTKVELFLEGMRSAYDFLKDFDWEKYKATRGRIHAASAPEGALA